MQRRPLLLAPALWAVGFSAFSEPPAPSLADQARRGGVLLVRHASTEPGLGDPPGFTLGQCSTQRNLSEAGRAQARAMGDWFRHHRLPVQTILSSQWCRCHETARLAFDHQEDWPALNSTFAGQGQQTQQLRLLRERLLRLPAGTLEVWITHQVIMTGLTGAYPAMAEGFLVDTQGALLTRGMLTSGA